MSAEDRIKYGADHIRESIKQVNLNTWLVADYILTRKPYNLRVASWYDAEHHVCYILRKARLPLPLAGPLDSPHFRLIHDVGDESAVYQIGSSAICKIRYEDPGVTPESVTLDFVKKQSPSFDVPDVYRQIFGQDRTFLFIEKLPGRTLNAAWPTLTERQRLRYVKRATAICTEMAQWRSCTIAGVDGQGVAESWLSGEDYNFNSQVQRETCAVIGMDCGKTCFQHADMTPHNLIVEMEPVSDWIGVIDFEIAGYLPRAWLRTKIYANGAMDLTSRDVRDPQAYRKLLDVLLKKKGFEEVSNAWYAHTQRLESACIDEVDAVIEITTAPHGMGEERLEHPAQRKK